MSVEQDKYVPLKYSSKYRMIKDLTPTGDYVFVQLARNIQTDQYVAIKLFPKGPKFTERFNFIKDELLSLRNLDNKHVISFHEVIQLPAHVGLVMEYANLGDLFNYVSLSNGLTEAEARYFFQQIVMGLQYMHQNGIVCKDLKLENILICGSRMKPLVKICDLGIMQSTEQTMKPQDIEGWFGTPEYYSPEMLNFEQHEPKAGDMWRLGVVLYMLLTGSYPFVRKCDGYEVQVRYSRMFQRIKDGDYLLPQGISCECLDLLESLLDSRWQRRFTLENIQQHNWYQRDIQLVLDIKEQSNLQRHQSSEDIIQVLLQAK